MSQNKFLISPSQTTLPSLPHLDIEQLYNCALAKNPGSNFDSSLCVILYIHIPSTVSVLLLPWSKPASSLIWVIAVVFYFPCFHCCPPTVCSQDTSLSDLFKTEGWLYCLTAPDHPVASCPSQNKSQSLLGLFGHCTWIPLSLFLAFTLTPSVPATLASLLFLEHTRYASALCTCYNC